MVTMTNELLKPEDRAAWRAWLAENHAASAGVWVAIAKKGTAGLAYVDAVEEALCFGWIDGKARSLDERHYQQWLSPRRPGSAWARSNKERVARLEAAGLMAPAGLAVVAAAKADGSWEAYDAIDALEMPADLEAALRAEPAAWENYQAFPPSAQRAVLFRVADAKRPETRARRIAEVVRMAVENRRPGQ